MAIIKLYRAWINLISTGEAVTAYTSDKGYKRSSNGSVRTYAGGRTRNVSSAGTNGELTVKLRDVTQSQIDTLDAWREQTIQFRDHRGRKIFGVYHEVAVGDRKVTTLYDVSLVIQELTYNEAV